MIQFNNSEAVHRDTLWQLYTEKNNNNSATLFQLFSSVGNTKKLIHSQQ